MAKYELMPLNTFNKHICHWECAIGWPWCPMGSILVAHHQHPWIIVGLVMSECAKLDECSNWLPFPILTIYPNGGMGSNVEIKINGIQPPTSSTQYYRIHHIDHGCCPPIYPHHGKTLFKFSQHSWFTEFSYPPPQISSTMIPYG